MKGGRSERALKYVNRSTPPVIYYNEFARAWIHAIAKAFQQRIRSCR